MISKQKLKDKQKRFGRGEERSTVTRVLDYVRPLFYGNPRRENLGRGLTFKVTSKTFFKTACQRKRCKHCLAVLLFRILLVTLVQIRTRILPKSDADPESRFQFDVDPDPTTHLFPELVPPMLQNDPLRLQPFHFDSDPDPAFHFKADPDPAFNFNAKTCGSGSSFPL
jgi:hypothetical protein